MILSLANDWYQNYKKLCRSTDVGYLDSPPATPLTQPPAFDLMNSASILTLILL